MSPSTTPSTARQALRQLDLGRGKPIFRASTRPAVHRTLDGLGAAVHLPDEHGRSPLPPRARCSSWSLPRSPPPRPPPSPPSQPLSLGLPHSPPLPPFTSPHCSPLAPSVAPLSVRSIPARCWRSRQVADTPPPGAAVSSSRTWHLPPAPRCRRERTRGAQAALRRWGRMCSLRHSRGSRLSTGFARGVVPAGVLVRSCSPPSATTCGSSSPRAIVAVERGRPGVADNTARRGRPPSAARAGSRSVPPAVRPRRRRPVPLPR